MGTGSKFQQLLMTRDWSLVEARFRQSLPYSHVILDDFLLPEFCVYLREELLNHWGWHYRNWINDYLTDLALETIPEVGELATTVQKELPRLLGQYPFNEYWAIMQHRNVGLNPHADNGAIAVNLWLTPDEYNLNPATGGLLLFDVIRTPEMAYHEFASMPWCRETFERNTHGEQIKIDYRYNRAIIFDAAIFHTTDTINFSMTATRSHRISLTIVYDYPDAYRERIDRSTRNTA